MLIPAFEQKAKIKIKVVAVGTGQAIQLASDGNADVLLVHARASEDKFIADGLGSNAWDVMYNQFQIVGPENDPAGIDGTTDAAKALQTIAEKSGKFISRGDDSETHKKEFFLWKDAALNPNGKNWYVLAGQEMGDTLRWLMKLAAILCPMRLHMLIKKDCS